MTNNIKKLNRIIKSIKIESNYKIKKVLFIETKVFIIFSKKRFGCWDCNILIENPNILINNKELINLEYKIIDINNKEDKFLIYTEGGIFIYNYKDNNILKKENNKIENNKIEIKDNNSIIIINKKKEYIKFNESINKIKEIKDYIIISTNTLIYIFKNKKYLKPIKIFFNTLLINIYTTDYTIILECKSTYFYYITLYIKNKLRYSISNYLKEVKSIESIKQTGIKFHHQNLIFKIFKYYIKIKKKEYKYEKESLCKQINIKIIHRINQKNSRSFKRKFKRGVMISEDNLQIILIIKKYKIYKRLLINYNYIKDNIKKIIDYDYEKEDYLFIIKTKEEVYLIFINSKLTNNNIIIKNITYIYKKINNIKNILFIKNIRCALNKRILFLSISNEIFIFKIINNTINFISNFTEIDSIKLVERNKNKFLVSCGNNLSQVFFILQSPFKELFIKRSFNLQISYKLIKYHRKVFYIYNIIIFSLTINNVIFLELKKNKLFIVNKLGNIFIHKVNQLIK